MSVTDQEAVYNDTAATVDELNAAAQAVKDTIARHAEESTTADNPIDLTACVTNPTYDDGNGNNSFDGWTGQGYNFGNDGTQRQALLIEYYNKTFDLNQTINGLPDGKYKVQVNAFYRYGTSAQDYEHYLNGDANLNAFMYATSGTDSTTTALALLGSGARKDSVTSGTSTVGTEGLVVPNDMASASKWFTDGFYVNTIDSVTVKDGTLTIGIRKDCQRRL